MTTTTNNPYPQPAPATGSLQNDLADFLMFRTYLTPWLIRIGWWFLLGLGAFVALTMVFAGSTGAALGLVIVILAWRVLAELSMVLFGILEELRRR